MIIILIFSLMLLMEKMFKRLKRFGPTMEAMHLPIGNPTSMKLLPKMVGQKTLLSMSKMLSVSQEALLSKIVRLSQKTHLSDLLLRLEDGA